MKRVLIGLFATFAMSGAAFAVAPDCELKADAAWIEQGDFELQLAAMGYTVESLSVSDGNCYEVTGKNSSDQGVKAWFNPQTGDVVQEDVAQ